MAEEIAKTKKPIYKRWWVWALGFVVLIIIVSASNGGSNNNSPSSNSQVSQNEQPAPAIKVTATQLLADYEANAVAADEKYKGKMVEVSGTIKDIGKDILDDPYISLESGTLIFGVQCMFDKSDASKLVSLSKNQKITLTGKVSGKLGNVIVRECNF